MNLTLSELQSLTPLRNCVILKPAVDPSKYGNLTLVQWDAFKAAPVVCTVISPPRRLIFGKRKVYHESVEELDLTPQQKMYLYQIRREAKFTETTLIDQAIPGSMMWKTKVEVKAGDVVWVNPNMLMNAEQQGNTLIADDELYYVIPYEGLYLKKDGDQVRMLNGWVLAELVEQDIEWQKRAEKIGMFIPPQLRGQQFTDRIGIIKYIGEPVDYIFNDRYDHPEIKVGDTILFKHKVNRRLEPGRKFFAKDQADLIVTRRANILAII